MWLALHAISTPFWFLPAGLRLATLIVLPRHLWWRMAVVEWIAAAIMVESRWNLTSPLAYVCALVTPWLIYAAFVRVCGRRTSTVMTPLWMGRQLAVGAMAALCNGLALTAVVMLNGLDPQYGPERILGYAIGDFVGIVMVGPLVFVLREHWLDRSRDWGLSLAHGLVLIPIAVLLGALALSASLGTHYPMLLAAIPMLWIAHHHGWRPAAIALGLIAVGVGLGHVLHVPLQLDYRAGQIELLAGLLGAASLLLASNADAVRIQGAAVRTLNQRLWAQAQELRAAATRLASQQEHERRHLGAELHDALGQDMTAIATRLRLLQRRAAGSGLDGELEDLRALVSTAHAHLRDAINHLHPVSLTRFGLVRALTLGPVAEMARSAGVRYQCLIEGPVAQLPTDIATMLYRISQEAATNAVRHGCGGFLQIEIILEPNDGGGELALRITDHAGELEVPAERLGHGLQSIRDRADALGAAYRFNPRSGLPRHWLQMRVAALEPAVESGEGSGKTLTS
ncbi:MASE1 domain-containing protein [Lysobacter korlensis]|uniref:histidine kinase n=1 Tax=Lysobacter korlensis TaxID=553636 RepID=A0ABV6RL61_9GAMM